MTETTGEISEIPEIGAEEKELLEATGVENLISLADSDAYVLRQEMEQANNMLELTHKIPEVEEIQSWITKSQDIMEYRPEGVVTRLVPVEEIQEELVEEVLYAIPIPPKHMVKQKISVDQIPVMDSFVEEDEEEAGNSRPKEEVPQGVQDLPRIGELPPVQNNTKAAGPQIIHIEPKEKTPIEIDPEIEKTRDYPIEPLQSNVADIRKAPSTGLNAGKTPHSRGYIRGVLHPQPVRVRIAAIITIITMIMFLASFAAGVLLILNYPLWVAIIPAAFVVIGLVYLMVAKGMSCRICGQPLYSPKACRKHVKAHHIRFLGYIFPTCFHVLLFSWFRCIYCGTSVRVKE